jgi:hypothetical protein
MVQLRPTSNQDRIQHAVLMLGFVALASGFFVLELPLIFSRPIGSRPGLGMLCSGVALLITAAILRRDALLAALKALSALCLSSTIVGLGGLVGALAASTTRIVPEATPRAAGLLALGLIGLYSGRRLAAYGRGRSNLRWSGP